MLFRRRRPTTTEPDEVGLGVGYGARAQTELAVVFGFPPGALFVERFAPWGAQLEQVHVVLERAGFADLVEDERLSLVFQWVVIHELTTFESLNDSLGVASGRINQLLNALAGLGYLEIDRPQWIDVFRLTDAGERAAQVVRDALLQQDPGSRDA